MKNDLFITKARLCLAIYLSVFLTAVSAYSASAELCLSLFTTSLTEPTHGVQSTADRVARTRAQLSGRSAKSVQNYLAATADSSRETFRYLQQIREESKLKLYRDKPEKTSTPEDVQQAVLNLEAPIFFQLASLIFPKDFHPNRSEDWAELKKKLQKSLPVNQVISFLRYTEKIVTDMSLPEEGAHLFNLVQGQFVDLFHEIYPQIPESQKLALELAWETRINRDSKKPLVSKNLLGGLTLLEIYSERIHLALLTNWLHQFADISLIEDEADQDRLQAHSIKKSYRQSLETALTHQLGLAKSYSPQFSSKIYWLLAAHPELLKFVLNPNIRLPVQTNSLVRQVLTDLTQGRLKKDDYDLALKAAKYLKNFELESEFLVPSLEILAQAKDVFPSINLEAMSLLDELKP